MQIMHQNLKKVKTDQSLSSNYLRKPLDRVRNTYVRLYYFIFIKPIFMVCMCA
jgi:hypothetical protein